MATAPVYQQFEEIWRERANRLSRRLVDGTTALNSELVMVLGIGPERYGIDLSNVKEVLAPVVPTVVPGAAASCAGVINVHGEIMPVMDLRTSLSLDARPAGATARIIVLCSNGREAGLQVDTVEQIRRIDPLDLRGGVLEGAEATNSRHIRGSTNDLLMLLSTESLFSELNAGDTK